MQVKVAPIVGKGGLHECSRGQGWPFMSANRQRRDLRAPRARRQTFFAFRNAPFRSLTKLIIFNCIISVL